MPPALEILLGRLADAAQVAEALLLRGWRLDLREIPVAQTLSELAGVSAIRLDALARLARNERRRHDDAVQAGRPQDALPPVVRSGTKPTGGGPSSWPNTPMTK